MTTRTIRPLSPRFARSLKLGALVLAAGSGYAIHGARAAGVPGSPDGLVYSGVATDGSGNPLTGAVTINVAVYDAAANGSKACEATKTPAEVDSEGNFHIAMDDCADDMHDSANLWVEVTVDGVALGRTKIGAVPYALEAANAVVADLASDSELLDGKPATDFADAAHAHAFSSLSGVPTGLADGDDDTTYTASTGLDLSGQNAFSVDPAEVQTRVKQAAVSGAAGGCAAGFSIRTIAQDGSVVCEADTDSDTTYIAGPGLKLTSNQLEFESADFTWCSSGAALRSISGVTATCETLPTITPWVAYAPNVRDSDGSPNPTPNQTSTGFWRRVGDTIEVRITTEFTGVPTGSTFNWELPNLRAFDGSKLSGTYPILGTASVGVSQGHICVVGTDNALRLGNSGINAGRVWASCDGQAQDVGPTVPETYGDNHMIYLQFSGPIVGW